MNHAEFRDTYPSQTPLQSPDCQSGVELADGTIYAVELDLIGTFTEDNSNLSSQGLKVTWVCEIYRCPVCRHRISFDATNKRVINDYELPTFTPIPIERAPT